MGLTLIYLFIQKIEVKFIRKNYKINKNSTVIIEIFKYEMLLKLFNFQN